MKNRLSIVFLFVFLLGFPLINGEGLCAEIEVDEKAVVIGYGSRYKSDVISAISTIDSDIIEKNSSMTPELSMQGTMSGVQVSDNTGNPMSRPTIRIRGANTWGVSNPLYVIDGIPIIELAGEAMSSMSLIDPNDIESISVLKDAAAAAIYGMRAANGVVLITTKKGSKGKPTVDFSGRFGVQNIYQELDFYDTQKYTAFVQDMYKTNPSKAPNVNNQGLYNPAHSRYLGNSPTYNWADAARHKNAPTQDYSVRVSGRGAYNTDYYVSMGYSNTEGALEGNYMRRYSGSVKINTTINKWLRTGINYRLAYGKGRDGIGDYFGMASAVPWQPIYQEGKEMPGYNGYAYVIPGFYNNGRGGKWDQTALYGAGAVTNELGRLASNNNWDADLRNMGTAYVELIPLKGLSVKGSIGIDYSAIDRFAFTDFDSTPFTTTGGNPWASAAPASVGMLSKGYSNSYNQMEEFTVNYANNFNSHNIALLFNFTDQHFMNNAGHSETSYVTTKKEHLMNLGGAREYNTVESFQNRFALMGYMFRAGYNYAHIYYIAATVRRDGSAFFAPEKRWGTFPSLSLAWRMAGEYFMEEVRWIDDLKLRFGWGRLGNQEVRRTYSSPIVNAGYPFAFGNNPEGLYPASGYLYNGATIYGIPNRDLEWERTETFNIGLDAQLFEGLSVSFEFYNKDTKGILQTINIPPSVGIINMPVANIARVRNSGIEFNLNYNGSAGNFKYSVGGNFTTVKNRVLETYESIPVTAAGNSSLGIEEGHSMFYHKAYKVGGVFQTQAEVDAWKEKHKDMNHSDANNLAPGDFYFQDLRGTPKKEGESYSEAPDGVIDSYDMVDIGNSLPGFFYGLNFNFEYKGFDLDARFTGVGDVVKYNRIKAETFFASEGKNVTDIVENRWRPNAPSGEYPRLVFGDPNSNLRQSDFFYESAAYLRCSNLQLGYTLPESVYKATNNNIRNIRVYIGLSNLFTITKYGGLDPESDYYPMPRTFYVGLNARF